jgi:hypothetical protein
MMLPSSPVMPLSSAVASSPDEPLDVPLLEPVELLLFPLLAVPLLLLRPPLLELEVEPVLPGSPELAEQCARMGASVQAAIAATSRKRRFGVIE